MALQTIPFTPSELELPDKFTRFRPGQQDAIATTLDHDGKFTALAMPTGSGKSLFYMGLSAVTGWRTCILTSTKGLQNQLLSDFSQVGLVDVRGRQNFSCNERAGWTCEQGARYRCGNAYQEDCPYFAQYQQAFRSRLVVTNYSYFISINQYSEGLGQFDLLVLDEAQNAPREITRAAAVEFEAFEIYGLLDHYWPNTGNPQDLSRWETWATLCRQKTEKRLERFETAISQHGRAVLTFDELDEYNKLSNLYDKFNRFLGRHGEWACQPRRHAFYFEPLWPEDYANSILFRFASKVVLVSATLIPYTLDLLNIGSSDRLYKEYPAAFPAHRSPFYHVPTTSVTFKSTKESLEEWHRRMDQIIRPRRDRKGIIHTVSYERAHDIKGNSEYGDLMETHDASETASVVEKFKEADPPSILVTPSVTTGYDFPGSECEFQIMSKLPTPNTMDPIMKARTESNARYRDYETAQALTQSAGRGMRHEKDFCENFSVDNMIPRHIFGDSTKDLYPAYFKKQYKKAECIPSPPPRIWRKA